MEYGKFPKGYKFFNEKTKFQINTYHYDKIRWLEKGTTFLNNFLKEEELQADTYGKWRFYELRESIGVRKYAISILKKDMNM